jgi:hypothetical protein
MDGSGWEANEANDGSADRPGFDPDPPGGDLPPFIMSPSNCVHISACRHGSIRIIFTKSVQLRVHWIQNSDGAMASMTRPGIGFVALQ